MPSVGQGRHDDVEAAARQHDVQMFKKNLADFIKKSGASLEDIAIAADVKPPALQAYVKGHGYAPAPFLVHERRDGLSRRRLLSIAEALLTLPNVPGRPTKSRIDQLLQKAGYAPLDPDLSQDKSVLLALGRRGERVMAGRCEAFKGGPGAMAGEWMAQYVADEKERAGPRLTFRDYLTTLALPTDARDAVLRGLPREEVPAWEDGFERRLQLFKETVKQFPVRHIYRRPALERWVMWLTDKGEVPLYSALITREMASHHFMGVIELLDNYGRRGRDEAGFEVGLSDEPGGFNFEIVGSGVERVLLIDSEVGRTPADHVYPKRFRPLDGLRIEGEEVIKLYEDAWNDAWNWATKGKDAKDELLALAEQLSHHSE